MSAPSTPRVVGLDLSLTRTGIALPDGAAVVLRPKTRGTARMVEVRDGVLNAWHGFTDTLDADIVAIEGFAFGARGRAVFDIGGVGWVIRVALHEAGVPYVEIPPSVLKRYATGRGNADKQAMQMAACKRLDYDDEKPDDNIVDALWLRALALDAYGHPVVDMPKAQRDASVAAVTWPRLRKAAA